jgi:predicted AAA+ superfamily ATPase
VTLDHLQELTLQRDLTERAWRLAIKSLATEHSTRTIARYAGVSHVTVHHMTKGVAR